jgi:hypothetical protein
MIKAIKRFIERLAKSNEETFGDKKLDCCDLNRNNNSQAVNNSTKRDSKQS